VPLTLTASGVAAHDVGPPNSGNAATPLHCAPAAAHPLDTVLDAVAPGQAENALSRNPTCAVREIHPPGNP